MDTNKIDEFITVLRNVKRKPQNLYDSGLVVGEKDQMMSGQDLLTEMQKHTKISHIVYDNETSDEETVSALASAFRKGQWILLEIQKNPGSLLLNQLQHISNSNNLQLMNIGEEDFIEESMSEQSRLVAFAKRDFIENNITYPNFYHLFGPVLSL